MFSCLQKTVLLTALIVSANSFAAVSEKHHFVKSDISYADGTESFKNPARGNAGGGWVTFKPEGLPNWHGVDRYASSLWELSRFSGGREQNGKRPPDARVGGEDIPITEAMKKRCSPLSWRDESERRIAYSPPWLYMERAPRM